MLQLACTFVILRRGVRYGAPINLEEYIQEYCSPVRDVSRAAVARLNSELERQLFGLTVNAPDWYALYLAGWFELTHLQHQGYIAYVTDR